MAKTRKPVSSSAKLKTRNPGPKKIRATPTTIRKYSKRVTRKTSSDRIINGDNFDISKYIDFYNDMRDEINQNISKGSKSVGSKTATRKIAQNIGSISNYLNSIKEDTSEIIGLLSTIEKKEKRKPKAKSPNMKKKEIEEMAQVLAKASDKLSKKKVTRKPVAKKAIPKQTITKFVSGLPPMIIEDKNGQYITLNGQRYQTSDPVKIAAAEQESIADIQRSAAMWQGKTSLGNDFRYDAKGNVIFTPVAQAKNLGWRYWISLSRLRRKKATSRQLEAAPEKLTSTSSSAVINESKQRRSLFGGVAKRALGFLAIKAVESVGSAIGGGLKFLLGAAAMKQIAAALKISGGAAGAKLAVKLAGRSTPVLLASELASAVLIAPVVLTMISDEDRKKIIKWMGTNHSSLSLSFIQWKNWLAGVETTETQEEMDKLWEKQRMDVFTRYHRSSSPRELETLAAIKKQRGEFDIYRDAHKQARGKEKAFLDFEEFKRITERKRMGRFRDAHQHSVGGEKSFLDFEEFKRITGKNRMARFKNAHEQATGDEKSFLMYDDFKQRLFQNRRLKAIRREGTKPRYHVQNRWHNSDYDGEKLNKELTKQASKFNRYMGSKATRDRVYELISLTLELSKVQAEIKRTVANSKSNEMTDILLGPLKEKEFNLIEQIRELNEKFNPVSKSKGKTSFVDDTKSIWESGKFTKASYSPVEQRTVSGFDSGRRETAIKRMLWGTNLGANKYFTGSYNGFGGMSGNMPFQGRGNSFGGGMTSKKYKDINSGIPESKGFSVFGNSLTPGQQTEMARKGVIASGPQGGALGPSLTPGFVPEVSKSSGKYRPVYNLSSRDLDPRVLQVIAGEARLKDQSSVDAVIHSAINRVGAKGWGPSKDLYDVFTAPGQYAGRRNVSKKEAEYIKSRIEAVRSGAVPDPTGGANSYRADWYVHGEGQGKTFYRLAQKQGFKSVGGNTYAYDKSVPNGPYASYAKPQPDTPGKTFTPQAAMAWDSNAPQAQKPSNVADTFRKTQIKAAQAMPQKQPMTGPMAPVNPQSSSQPSTAPVPSKSAVPTQLNVGHAIPPHSMRSAIKKATNKEKVIDPATSSNGLENVVVSL